jgi:CBS domain containing-hemolysin-like protein
MQSKFDELFSQIDRAKGLFMDATSQRLTNQLAQIEHKHSFFTVVKSWLFFFPCLTGSFLLSMVVPQKTGKQLFKKTFASIEPSVQYLAYLMRPVIIAFLSACKTQAAHLWEKSERREN